MRAQRFEARPLVKDQALLSHAEANEAAVKWLRSFPDQEIGIYRLVAIVRANVVATVEEFEDDGA